MYFTPLYKRVIWAAVAAGLGVIQMFFLSLSLFRFPHRTNQDTQGIYLEQAFYAQTAASLFWLKVALAFLFLFGPIVYLYRRQGWLIAGLLLAAEIITSGFVYWLYRLIRMGVI